MKATYALVGLGLVILIGAALYFTSYNQDGARQMSDTPGSMMTISSIAFENDRSIPKKYTCDADNVSPPLSISGIPPGTVSLALLMDDPDVPKVLKSDGVFDHWTLYSIPVTPGQTSIEISEGAVPGAQGLNGRGQEGYTGPCPPPDFQPTEHRYFFKVFALDTEISFFKAPTKSEVETAIQGHILSSAELVGRYDRAVR